MRNQPAFPPDPSRATTGQNSEFLSMQLVTQGIASDVLSDHATSGEFYLLVHLASVQRFPFHPTEE